MVHIKDHRPPVRISWKLREGVKYYFADLVCLKPVVLFSTTKFFTQKCCVWQAQVFFRYSAPFEEKYSRECKTSIETLYLLRAVLLQLKTKSWQDPNPGTLPQVFFWRNTSSLALVVDKIANCGSHDTGTKENLGETKIDVISAVSARSMCLNCILQELFRDTSLDHIWRVQIPAQNTVFGCIWPY